MITRSSGGVLVLNSSHNIPRALIRSYVSVYTQNTINMAQSRALLELSKKSLTDDSATNKSHLSHIQNNPKFQLLLFYLFTVCAQMRN